MPKNPYYNLLFDDTDGLEFFLIFWVQILSYLPLLLEGTTAGFPALGSSHNRPWLISAYSENNDIFILPDFSKMGKSLAGYSQSMQFCKAVGARLSYYVIDSHFTATLKECVQSCVKDPDCESLNYQTSSGICESNNFASVFETGLSSDFIHMTRLAPC